MSPRLRPSRFSRSMIATVILGLGGVSLFLWKAQSHGLRLLETPSLAAFQESWLNSIQSTSPQSVTFSLSPWLRSKKSTELLNLEYQLPHYHFYDPDDIQKLLANYAQAPIHPDLKKAWLWKKHTEQGQKLSRLFFETPPFIHPNGSSYVFLEKMLSSKKQPQTEFSSGDELMTLTESLQATPGVAQHLSENWKTLEAVLDRNLIIISNPYVFVKNPESEDSHSYFIFPKKDWDLFFKNQDFIFIDEIASQKTNLCLEKLDTGCWTLNPHKQKEKTTLIIALMMFLWVLAGVFLIYIYLKNKNNQNKQRAQQQLALQLLTHELRTPIASLSVILENLRYHYDELSVDLQKDFFQISEEIARLKRTADSSAYYLQTAEVNTAGHDASVAELVNLSNLVGRLKKDCGSDIDVKVSIRSGTADQPIKIHGPAEILFFVLSNLIRNAKSYGQPPWSVDISVEDSFINFKITDQGTSLQFTTLEKLLQKPLEQNKSQGLGLGLKIVRRLCEKYHWSLRFHGHPTTQFEISIPRSSHDNQ